MRCELYVKLFGKILDSSVWLENMPTRIVWLTLLAAMDKDGFAQFSAIGNVAARARVTHDEATAALACLESPDEESADKSNEGRRIERVDGGWMVLNAVKYREIATREIARQSTRERVASFRAKKLSNASVTACSDSVTPPSVSDSVSLSASLKEKDTPAQPLRRARTGSGVMAGALPRDHLRHAWCGRVCVPDFLHGQFVNATGQPDAALFAFYTETFTRIAADEPVEPDALKFWRPMVTARWQPATASNRITADDLVRTPEELARDEARDRRAAHGR